MTTSEMTPADIAAVTNNGNGGYSNGWGGDWGAWILIFVLFAMFGWGGFGFGGGFGGFGGGMGMQGALTRGDLCMDMNFNDLQNGVRNINDAVNVGFSNLNSTICHQQYDTAMLVNGVNNNLSNGFAGLNNAVCTLGYQNAQLINGLENTVNQGFNASNIVALQNQNALQTQLADCCCKTQTGQMQLGNQIERSICETNYNAANNTTAIIQNAHCDADRIIARLDAMEMSRKDETIADLRTKLAACNDQTTAQYIVNQITGLVSPRAVPAYPAPSPCGLGNWAPQVLANGYGVNGCGCCNG